MKALECTGLVSVSKYPNYYQVDILREKGRVVVVRCQHAELEVAMKLAIDKYKTKSCIHHIKTNRKEYSEQLKRIMEVNNFSKEEMCSKLGISMRRLNYNLEEQCEYTVLDVDN